ASDYNGLPGDPGFQEGSFVNAPFYIWNAGGGTTSTVGNGTESISHRFAPIGQGIMFVGTNPTTPQIVKIKNSHRRYIKQGTAHSVFHRPTEDISISNTR